MPYGVAPRALIAALALTLTACAGGGQPQAAPAPPQPAPEATTTTATTAAPATTATTAPPTPETTTTSAPPSTTAPPPTTTETTATTAPQDPAGEPDLDVAGGVWMALGAGDYVALAGYTAPHYDAGCAEDDLRRVSRIADTAEVKVSVVRVDDMGDWVVAVMRVEADDETGEVPVPLVAVDGEWYADIDHCLLAVNAAEVATQREIRSAIVAAKGFFTDNGHFDATPAELLEWMPTLELAAAGAEPGAGEVAYVNSNGRLLVYGHSPLGRSFCAALSSHDPVLYGKGEPQAVDEWDECAAAGSPGGWVEAPAG